MGVPFVTTSTPTTVGAVAAGGGGSPHAHLRPAGSVLLSTIGGVGMWSIAVVLPLVQADFGIDRADASLSYTAVMLGFVVGGPLMGRLSDRMGIIAPVALGAVLQGIGFAAASQAAGNWQFALTHGVLIGVGGSASFGPVIADISLWFLRRRGIAVAICSSGSYLAGAIWPLVIQPLVGSIGWRSTYLGIGVFCLTAMLPLVVVLRRQRPAFGGLSERSARTNGAMFPPGLSAARLQLLLMLAGGFFFMA